MSRQYIDSNGNLITTSGSGMQELYLPADDTAVISPTGKTVTASQFIANKSNTSWIEENIGWNVSVDIDQATTSKSLQTIEVVKSLNNGVMPTPGDYKLTIGANNAVSLSLLSSYLNNFNFSNMSETSRVSLVSELISSAGVNPTTIRVGQFAYFVNPYGEGQSNMKVTFPAGTYFHQTTGWSNNGTTRYAITGGTISGGTINWTQYPIQLITSICFRFA
jgi:hypothetical protein